jgi:hypothetical protein
MTESKMPASEFDQILANWVRAEPIIEANHELFERTLPGISPAQFKEAILAYCNYAKSVRAPHGFRPIWHIVKVINSRNQRTILDQSEKFCTSTTQNFEQNLRSFGTALSSAFAPLASLYLFSDKEDRNSGPSNLAAEFAQHIALFQTAQSELKAKMQSLDEADVILKDFKGKSTELQEMLKISNVSADEISDILTHLKELSSEADQFAAKTKEESDKITLTISHVEKLKADFEMQRAKFDAFFLAAQSSELKLRASLENNASLIESLLPRATSAGLASAFNRYKKRYEKAQYLWGFGFVLSIVSLCGFGFYVESGLPKSQSASEIWIFLAHRIPLAAPLIWLGWFCAIQYGNIIRLMEDYAFKEATSMAFAGYRDHMEHLTTVTDEGAEKAIDKLTSRTVEILSAEPLRLLQKQHLDVSPMAAAKGIIPNSGKATD